MPRPTGVRVIICLCGRRCVGRPGHRITCGGCGRRVRIPKEKARGYSPVYRRS